ncbi:MAG: hypothetical protein GXY33_05295 [Phycisphaerae bacterium]|mgnify:FL=1|nr:hypothetical protein [Phycisphaerae bacterium]
MGQIIRHRALLIVLVLTVLGCRSSSETQPFVAVFPDDLLVLAATEQPFGPGRNPLLPAAESRWSLKIITPDPSIDYKIVHVRPDPRIDYRMIIIDPESGIASPYQSGRSDAMPQQRLEEPTPATPAAAADGQANRER